MNLPAEALQDLKRCGPALFRYTVATLLTLLLFRLVQQGCARLLTEDAPPQLSAMVDLLLALALGVAASAVQAVYLAGLGAAIDKPLWKCKGAVDALQRFFVPWLIINLAAITLLDVQSRFVAADMSDVAAFIELFVLAVHVASVPVGACIMHWGALEWRELGEALRPLGRLMPLTLFPLAAGGALYMLASLRVLAATDSIAVNLLFFSVTDIPLVLLEAFVFAMVWRLCMHHRALPAETGDPFDF